MSATKRPKDVLNTALGTENVFKAMHRKDLPVGHPDDLSRSSTVATGSLGNATLPIVHRQPPFKMKGDH